MSQIKSSNGHKRPLEETDLNIMRSLSPKRRAFSGSEMIKPSVKKNSSPNISIFESKLPMPMSTHEKSLNYEDTQLSQDQRGRILSIQSRLSRKPTSIAPPRLSRNFSANTNVTRSNELNEAYFSLNEQYREKQQRVDNLTEELYKLRRINRNYSQKLESIKDEISQNQETFEYMEETVLQNVANEEKLIDIKLEENQMKLNNQFRELEFEMLQELNEVKNFDYSELIEKIECLKREKTEINEEIRKSTELAEIKLKEEIKKSEEATREKLANLKKEENESQTRLVTKQKELETVRENHSTALNTVNTYIISVESEKARIQEIERKMNNFQQVRKTLDSKLRMVSQEVRDKIFKGEIEQSEFDKVKAEYNTISAKIKKHDEHRRILENSIMDYQRRIRVYAISQDIINPNQFNKIFTPNSPPSHIMDEFSHLIKGAIRGTNVALISQYLAGSTIIINAMTDLLQYTKQKMENWDIGFDYQCTSLANGALVDLLTNTVINSTSSLFRSQKMIIDDLDQFAHIVNGLENRHESDTNMLHVVSISGVKGKTNFESRLLVLDVCKTSPSSQVYMLEQLVNIAKTQKRKDDDLVRLLDWVYTNCKILILAECQNSKMANVLRTLNSTSLKK